MEKRILGKTGLSVGVLGIGGGAFSGKERKAVTKSATAALQGGVNLIDTAPDYGEEKLKNVLRRYPNTVVISKSTAQDYKSMKAAIEKSVKLLGRVDIYLMQTIMSEEDFLRRKSAGVLKAMEEAKKEKMINFTGLSGHRIDTLIKILKSEEFDVVEAPYSVGQHRTLELIGLAGTKNMGFIAMLVFGGGVLVDRDKKCDKARHMNSWNMLSWVLSTAGVSCALVGMSDIEHVEDNLEAAEKLQKLTSTEKLSLERKVKNFLGPRFCMSCKACMPCDEHGWAFDIDNFFRFYTWYAKYGYTQFKDEYKKLGMKADACTECEKCEPRCPYKVPIVKRLKEVHKVLGS